MKWISKLRYFFPCKHCRLKIYQLEKETAYWKQMALNFKKNHQ